MNKLPKMKPILCPVGSWVSCKPFAAAAIVPLADYRAKEKLIKAAKKWKKTFSPLKHKDMLEALVAYNKSLSKLTDDQSIGAIDILCNQARHEEKESVGVPRELTAENGMKAALIGGFSFVPYEGEAAVTVPWTIIKEIHRAVVEFAAKAVKGDTQ